MNRRHLFRAGLGSGLFYFSYSNSTVAQDQKSSASAPNEPPPIPSSENETLSLNAAIESKKVEVRWKLVESNRVLAHFENKHDERILIQINPGTVLTHENSAWLVGGPTQYVGHFAGQMLVHARDGSLSSVTVPILGGRSLDLQLPVVSLTANQPEKFSPIENLNQQTVHSLIKDPKLANSLTFLSSVGCSLNVAQGLAWCLNANKKTEELTSLSVEGIQLNNFEKQAIARFLNVRESLTVELTAEQMIQELEKDKLSVQLTAFGKKRLEGQKILSEILPGSRFMGLPIHHLSTKLNDDHQNSVIKLEFHVDNQIRPDLYAVEASLALRTGISGSFVKLVKTRFPLQPSTDAHQMLDWIEVQTASALAKLVRTGKLGMSSRFRIQNQSPLNLSALEVMTNTDSSDPAYWSLEDLGIAPRGRTMVQIPSNSAKAIRIRFSAI